MKNRVFMTLFSLPFAGFGLFMLWLVGTEFLDAAAMRSWYPVQAEIVDAGTTRHSDSDGTTYEAYATYRYFYNGSHYTGTRVSLGEGADNIGDYQTEMGRRLERAKRNGEPITVYVDPEQPSSAIIDPNLRWGFVAFKLAFGLVFGGIGFGLLYASLRASREPDMTEPQFVESPWLANERWQTAQILSGSKTAMYGAWAFAGIWNLVSAPLPFILYGEITQKENYVALIGLLFPLIGIGLLAWAIRQTAEWRRFGPAPVTLDPFPGSIGGHVGGTIDINLPFDSNNRFQLTLSNLHSYYSGSGKNRSRKERAKWQDKLVAHAEPGGAGTRIAFRFDVPENLHPSDIEEDDSYHLWRLNLKAVIEGPDIDRDYDIPVFATGQQSSRLSEHAVRRGRAEQSKLDDAAVIKAVKVQQGVSGKTLVYPAFRNAFSNLAGIVFGLVFAGAGAYLIVEEEARIFGGVFALVGGLVMIAALYMLLNSLTVTQDGMSIKTVRRVLGIPVKRREMRRDMFRRFEKHSSLQSQSGTKHVMHYKVRAVDRDGNQLVIGEGFKGDNEANAAIRFFERELSLSSRDNLLA